jgi:hypothetical protein
MTARSTYLLPLAVFSLLGAAAVASCVGNDPTLVDTGSDAGGDGGVTTDAGTDGASTSDGGADAADAADAHVFAPSDLGARLVLWYAAAPANVILSDAGDGKVVRWTDLSSFKLDAKPTIKGTGGGPNANFDDAGKAGGPNNYLEFDDGLRQLGDDGDQPNLAFGGREFLIEIVASMDSGGNTSDVPLFARRQGFGGHTGALDITVNSGIVTVAVKDDDAGAQPLTSSNATLIDHAMHVVAMRRSHQAALAKDSLQLRIDGVHEEIGVDPVNLDLAGADFFFGSDYSGFGPVPGYVLRIAEMVVISSPTALPVTDDEVNAVEKYLKVKYGTP